MNSNGRIDALTSLRFFAAAAVFLHHSDFLQRTSSTYFQNAFNWFFEGFSGVQFFYVLSGFVISYSFTDGDFRTFLFHRAARIFPIHWLTLVVATLLYGAFFVEPPQAVLSHFVANVLLVQSFIADPAYYFSLNGVSWSISDEMFFYVAFCGLALMPTRAAMALWGAILVVILFNIMAASKGTVDRTWLLYVNPFFRLLDFLTGVLLFRAFKAFRLNIYRGPGTALEISSLVVLALFVIVAVSSGVPLVWRWDLYYVPPMALVLFVFAHQAGAISEFLQKRWLVLLGDASFALYMTHQILIGMVFHYVNPQSFTSSLEILGAIGGLLAVGVTISVALHLGFEKPVNRALRRWWAERGKTKTAAAHAMR